jgi:hypothetical protein
MLKRAESPGRMIFLFLLVFAVIIGSLFPNFVFADSCVRLSKVDHKIVEDRSSYFMIRFRGNIINGCEENLNGSAEFVIADENSKRVKNIPGDILLNVPPNVTYKIDQTFPIFKQNYKKGYQVFLDFYKKNRR